MVEVRGKESPLHMSPQYTVVVKKNLTFLKTPLPLHSRFDKRHGNATATERQRCFRVSN